MLDIYIVYNTETYQINNIEEFPASVIFIFMLKEEIIFLMINSRGILGTDENHGKLNQVVTEWRITEIMGKQNIAIRFSRKETEQCY